MACLPVCGPWPITIESTKKHKNQIFPSPPKRIITIIVTENNPTNSAEEAEAALAAKREELERDIKGLHLRKQRRILRDFDRSHGKLAVLVLVWWMDGGGRACGVLN